MKKYTAYIIGLIVLIATSCRDDFGDINSPTDKVTDPDPVRLFTEALVTMDERAYIEWFYNNSYFLKWGQATVTEGGNQSSLNQISSWDMTQNRLLTPKLQIEEIRYCLRTQYTEAEAAKYRYLEAICNPVLVFLGLRGTDMHGSMAYSEASTAPYTSPANITPRYQTQKELFDVWLDELDETITILTAPVKVGQQEVTQIAPGTQDLIYGGDWTKWAKLANSLKLKIAVRMLGVDRTKALAIAEEVAVSPAGIMSAISDDMVYTQGTQFYRTENAIENTGLGSKHLIDYLRTNLDPRLRFLFAKNDFNASVVQAFFDAGRDVPFYILEQAEYTETGGQKVFNGWKAPGEPWVRYYGAPVDVQARSNTEIRNAYFNTENFRLSSNSGTKTYQPLSLYNEEMVRGSVTYTYPAIPDAATVQDNTPRQWYGALYSSAEVNLYLAEFALLGASLPESAESYYNRGVELSVRLLDHLASLNKIPYYEQHAGFDTTDKTIVLEEGEIAPLLARYALTGTNTEKMEQVYLQQYVHDLYMPQELLVTMRRSGYPATGSNLLERVVFNSTDPSYAIPRRLPVPALDPTDGMYEIKKAAYAAEGFTPGMNTPVTLQTEKVDYDKSAPAYGAGMQ